MIRQLTGRGVLLWLVAFFFVVAVVNFAFIFLSVETFRGEDEQKPYLQGIAYNRTLANRAEQARLGWKAAVSAQRLASGRLRISVDMRNRAGAADVRSALTAELRHPADENRDRSLRLIRVDPGHYLAEAGGISKGFWDVVIAGGIDGTPFESVNRVWVP